MKVERTGAAANHGVSSISLEGTSALWDEKDSCIVLRKNNVRDFNGSSCHDYKIYLTKNDFNEIVKALSDSGVDKNFGKVEKFLENTHRYLNRLLSIASGIFPKNQPRKSLPFNINKRKEINIDNFK